MFGDNLRLPLLHCRPVQLAPVHALNPEFFGLFEMVPELSVEKKRFSRDAAHVQTRPAEHVILF